MEPQYSELDKSVETGDVESQSEKPKKNVINIILSM